MRSLINKGESDSGARDLIQGLQFRTPDTLGHNMPFFWFLQICCVNGSRWFSKHAELGQ